MTTRVRTSTVTARTKVLTTMATTKAPDDHGDDDD